MTTDRLWEFAFVGRVGVVFCLCCVLVLFWRNCHSRYWNDAKDCLNRHKLGISIHIYNVCFFFFTKLTMVTILSPCCYRSNHSLVSLLARKE